MIAVNKKIGFRVIRFGDVPWEPRTEDEWPCLVKRQIIDPDTNMTARIVWYARGAVEPRHVHGGSHAAVVLVGEALVGGVSLKPWDVVYGPGNVPHGALDYPSGCMLFATLNGGALHTAVGDAPDIKDGVPAQGILEAEREWLPAGKGPDGWECEQKVMLQDPGRDYSSTLERWARGSVDPRHVHDGTHAALILSGRAVVDGVVLGPWDLIYAPGGVAHGPIEFPEGCTFAVSASGSMLRTRTE